MPWFIDFVAAGELARREQRAAAQADPVTQYFAALNDGDARQLETVWPGDVVVYDPYAGEVRGHKELLAFVQRSRTLLEGRHARTEALASAVAGDRAVLEVVAHLSSDGQEQAWPVAVVAQSIDDRSIVFRSYFSHWAIDGRRRLRPALLQARSARSADVVERYHKALMAGDTEALVSTFAPDGYYREAVGPPTVHRGPDELRSFFTRCFSAGGGIELQTCMVTEDGARCAVEYNCVRWGRHELEPQAGLAVFERRPDGRLGAARVYDDIEPPVDLTS